MKSLLQYRITGFKGAFWIIKSSCYLSVARCRTISSTRTLLLKRLLLYPDAKEGVEGHQHILELDNSISYNLLVISYLGLLVGISYPFSWAKTPGSATSLPVVGPCRSSAKEGRVPNHGSHKEHSLNIFVLYLGRKGMCSFHEKEKNVSCLLSSNGGR